MSKRSYGTGCVTRKGKALLVSSRAYPAWCGMGVRDTPGDCSG